MEFWNDTIQTVKEWRPVNYSVAEDEDFEAVKKKQLEIFKII